MLYLPSQGAGERSVRPTVAEKDAGAVAAGRGDGEAFNLVPIVDFNIQNEFSRTTLVLTRMLIRKDPIFKVSQRIISPPN